MKLNFLFPLTMSLFATACASSGTQSRIPSSPPPVFQCDAVVTNVSLLDGNGPAVGTKFHFFFFNWNGGGSATPNTKLYYQDSLYNYFAAQNGGEELLEENPVVLKWSRGITDGGGPMTQTLTLIFTSDDRSSGTYDDELTSGIILKNSWHTKASLSNCH